MRELTSASDLFGRPPRVGDCVVVVPVFGAGPTWNDCVLSLLEHTGSATPIVLFDDAGPTEMADVARTAEDQRPGREFFYYRQPTNRGFVGNVNDAFDFVAPADVIVLNSDTIVGPGWESRLIEAGRSRSTIATATALTNNGTIYSVPAITEWNTTAPSRDEVARAATRVASRSQLLRPHMPTATSFATYYSRRALNVVGHFDPVFSPGYGEEVDFCIRATNLGFVHIAADDVLVYHAGGETFGDTTVNTSKHLNDVKVNARHPHWQRQVDEFIVGRDSPRERALHLAGSAARGLTLLLDAENVHPELTGTYEGSVSLARALDAHPDVARIVWTASAGRQPDIEAVVARLDLSKSEFIATERLDQLPVIDVAFRPCQDFSGQHWPELASLGFRNIIWILDLIATHIHDYSASYDAFNDLRESMELSMLHADRVAVLTPHVKRDLESFARFVTQEKIFILPNGAPAISPELLEAQAGNRQTDDATAVEREHDIEELTNSRYVLILGTNFRHKNWPWLIRLMSEVSARGWNGRVVFAGPTPALATSSGSDRRAAQAWDENRVVFLGRLSDEHRLRLLAAAELVISPTISEGWGMIPQEAAAMGAVPVATRGGGLDDITPETAAYLTLADDEKDAQTVFELLSSSTARHAQLAAWRETALPTWADSADILVNQMFEAIARPGSWQAPPARRRRPREVRAQRLSRFIERGFPRGTFRRRIVSAVARIVRSLRRLLPL